MKPFRFVVLFISVLLLTACNFTLAADVTPPPGYQQPTVAQEQEVQVEATSGPLYPILPPDPAKGEPIFNEKCAPCHGTTGLGDGPRAVDLPNPAIPVGTTDVARQAAPDEWFKVVTEGNLERFMPPFQSLTDRQRWDVVAYMFTLSASDERVIQGAETYRENCAICHGERGKGENPDAEDLADLLPDFTDQALMAEKSAEDLFQAISNGSGPYMPAFGDNFSEDERWVMTEYIRSLTFAPLVAEAPGDAYPDPGETPTTAQSELADTSTMSETARLGMVSGVVVNTSGGDLPQDMVVTLHGFEHVELVMTDTTRVEAGGGYIFSDVDMPEGRMFLATVEFQETKYGSEVVVTQPGQTEIDLPIEIYETTTDSSELVIDRLHFFFEFLDENTLRVAELYIISNPTQKTLVATGEGQPTITFTLPEEAANLEFEDGILGGRYIETADGFGDTIAIRPDPNDHQVLFAYELPYDRKLDLVRPLNMATNAVVILIPEDGIRIKGDQISDEGTRDVEGVQFRMYSGSSLESGEDLRLQVTGRSTGDNPALASESNVSLLVGLGALGLALIVIGVWLFRRNQNGEKETSEDEELVEANELDSDDPETIMDAILALDDLYKEGELPEDAYSERRSELKDRLRDIYEDQDSQ